MSCENSKVDKIETALINLAQIIKCLSDGDKLLALFNFLEQTLEPLSKVSPEFSDGVKKALQCIFKAKKETAIGVNDAKNLVSNAKYLCKTLNTVLNSQAGSNDKKICLAISLFEKSIGSLLSKLYNARDGLSKVSTELETIVLEIIHLKTWCLGKKQELANVRKISVAKERGCTYGGAAGTTVAVASTVAAVSWWSPIGLLAGLVAAGAAASSTAAVTFLVAVAVVEGVTNPELEKMFDDGIKGMQESVNKFHEMSNKNKERNRRLNENLEHLTRILSFALQSKADESQTLEFNVNDIMFNKLKKDISELEGLCETYLNM